MSLNLSVTAGATDVSVPIRIIDDTAFTPETDVTSASGGLALFYWRAGAAITAITEADLTNLDDAHSDGGLKHASDGIYRLDLPDAAVVAGVPWVLVGGTVTGMIVEATLVEIDKPVNVTKIAANAVSATAIADSAITANKLAADAITAAKVADGAIDAATFAAGAINAAAIATGAITAAKFGAGAIDAAAIADDAIDAGAIAANAITAAKIAANAITSAKLANGAITSSTFAAGAIDATVLADDAIDAAALVSDVATEINLGHQAPWK